MRVTAFMPRRFEGPLCAERDWVRLGATQTLSRRGAFLWVMLYAEGIDGAVLDRAGVWARRGHCEAASGEITGRYGPVCWREGGKYVGDMGTRAYEGGIGLCVRAEGLDTAEVT